MAVHPFLTRAAVEELFRLKRRQAIELMHSVQGYLRRNHIRLKTIDNFKCRPPG
jgi:hypothetical protein